ncbi:hypothetical protein B0T14DRAFT_179646 [Immersiella caudata]|uniref:Secreted protein n=1 Tax=Immersiella caudata TaxID=314043 RepID=A0AA39WXJ7_9PEZI|nr:hypothetical protein B0T14DRAFT_179646 [Immersiella caudata]
MNPSLRRAPWFIWSIVILGAEVSPLSETGKGGGKDQVISVGFPSFVVALLPFRLPCIPKPSLSGRASPSLRLWRHAEAALLSLRPVCFSSVCFFSRVRLIGRHPRPATLVGPSFDFIWSTQPATSATKRRKSSPFYSLPGSPLPLSRLPGETQQDPSLAASSEPIIPALRRHRLFRLIINRFARA